VARPDRGLFPAPRDIDLSCSCPDGAVMCKHVAAVLYGVGARLDSEPELLFRLRGVDPTALPATAAVARAAAKRAEKRARVLPASALGSVFGIELEGEDDGGDASATPPAPSDSPSTARSARSARPEAPRAPARSPRRPRPPAKRGAP